MAKRKPIAEYSQYNEIVDYEKLRESFQMGPGKRLANYRLGQQLLNDKFC